MSDKKVEITKERAARWASQGIRIVPADDKGKKSAAKQKEK